jgi:hypothetical protein
MTSTTTTTSNPPCDNIIIENENSNPLVNQIITAQSEEVLETTEISDNNQNEIAVDVSNETTHELPPAPLSIDSDYNGSENQFSNPLTDEQSLNNDCSAIQNEIFHQPPSSSASSTSKGDFSPSTPSNVLESAVFSSSYLYTLLDNLEREINVTQQHLDDENDKRHKYKVS